MKRKLVILLAAAATLVTVIAVAAGTFGRRSQRAHMDLDFNQGLVNDEGVAPRVSWVGTLDFRGGTYPIAFVLPGPLEQHGDWTFFEEIVTIYESLHTEWDGGVLTVFEPGKNVVEFSDKGWGSPRGRFYSWGRVTEADASADAHGVLDDVAEGDRVFWMGRYLDEAHVRVGGPFRILARG